MQFININLLIKILWNDLLIIVLLYVEYTVRKYHFFPLLVFAAPFCAFYYALTSAF